MSCRGRTKNVNNTNLFFKLSLKQNFEISETKVVAETTVSYKQGLIAKQQIEEKYDEFYP